MQYLQWHSFTRHGMNNVFPCNTGLVLPFSVKVKDGPPVTTGFLQITHNTGTSITEAKI